MKRRSLYFLLGTVDAFTGLECEIVYQPTFSAPDETDFLLHVTGGSDLKLKCLAKVCIDFAKKVLLVHRVE